MFSNPKLTFIFYLIKDQTVIEITKFALKTLIFYIPCTLPGSDIKI